ncbi:MAG: D-alanyl-D-alanine carboxypeptidase/D-alanyl-D-alanine-endopeptidase [Pseudopedobacter saltans]|uniref:D-alanyl-D-alanine carboxypeptidase/D-alanyl-D-alanine-endopeptidase n=1 Tax=Pseudopedobacter saltans TaxID=151895 RepID=A0A2W5FDA0_9SPHI|nr:MAG: D-alanyl-D-alanine carboxypeptidase/D-alanyl-D-alanine-endopeptidase [Pseudopedobacter saltans]
MVGRFFGCWEIGFSDKIELLWQMKKWLFSFGVLFLTYNHVHAQSIEQKLKSATEKLLSDAQMKNASLGFYVADGETGEKLYDYNGDVGLSPASTQKIFTSIASYDLLGQDFKFSTVIGYNGTIEGGVLKGDLIIKGFGDPTLGSWRYKGFKPEDVHNKIRQSLKSNGIRAIDGNVIVDDGAYALQPMPGGWPWNDMGNYYGAPCWGFNWLENQYDITFRPGKKIGEETSIAKISEDLPGVTIINQTTTAESGSGDQSSILLPPYGTTGIITGTLPLGKNTTASGSIPNPPLLFVNQLKHWLESDTIYTTGYFTCTNQLVIQKKNVPVIKKSLDTLFSPSMDDMMYYFLQRSINLYGESFVKAIGWKKAERGETAYGVGIVRNFWEGKGVAKNALKMIDGSGLSPQNYDAASSEVKALLYAKKQAWFDGFYKALPIYNNTKMKSGTISMCKAFTGYQKASNGKQYVFSIIINNYNGAHDAIVNKMYQVLNVLK